MATRFTEVLGYVAATMTTVAFVPQLVRVIKLRSAHDVSLGMFLIFIVGTGCWIGYGLEAHSAPVMIANIATFVLASAILVLKVRFDRHAVDAVQPRDAPR